MEKYKDFTKSLPDKAECKRLNKIAKTMDSKGVADTFTYKWGDLHKYGLAQQITSNIVHDYGEYLDNSWIRVFTNNEPSYKELLVEFLTSFTYTPGDQNPNFNTNQCITFRLGLLWHNISLVQFGILLDLADPQVNPAAYTAFLNTASIGDPAGYYSDPFWKEITFPDSNKLNGRESHLLNPLHRIFHRIMVWTVTPKKQVEKINQEELLILYYMINREHPFHFPLASVDMFKNAQKGVCKELIGGQFVTKIARNLGLVTNVRLNSFLRSYNMTFKEDFLLKSYILKKVENGAIRVYHFGEARDEGKGKATSTSSKRPKNSNEGASGSSNQEFSLKGLMEQNNLIIKQNNVLGGMMDDQQAHNLHTNLQNEWIWRHVTGQGTPDDIFPTNFPIQEPYQTRMTNYVPVDDDDAGETYVCDQGDDDEDDDEDDD